MNTYLAIGLIWAAFLAGSVLGAWFVGSRGP
jgi:hypothetical protein